MSGHKHRHHLQERLGHTAPGALSFSRDPLPKLRSLTPVVRTAPVVLPSRVRASGKDRPNWYSTARWQRLRLRRLDHDLWTCAQTGEVLVEGRELPNAAVVDHIVPHRWDPDLFWDWDNLQSVAKHWHDSQKQRIERARGGGG